MIGKKQLKSFGNNEVGVTRVFVELFNSEKPIVVLRGGARSSKTYSLAQYCVAKTVSEHNKKFLVCRKTMPSLKMTAMRDVISLFKEYGFYQHCDHNKTDNILTFKPTGSIVWFASVDDPEKLKSTGWNYIWMEEATDFSYDDYMILKLRLSEPNESLNQIFLSFNPISAFHWIKTDLIERDTVNEVDEIVSTYIDNTYLSDDYIKIIENSKSDESYWRVYGLGEWGSVDRIIYKGWKTVDKFPEEVQRTIWGLDFGFNDPSALVEVGLVEDMIFLKEHLYQSGLTNSQLIKRIKGIFPSMTPLLYADCAEPNRIREIRQAGISCKPAFKGANSVKDGIDFIKRHKIYITKDSVNLIKEIQGYQYMKKRDNRIVDDPSDTMNHLLDAVRYAIYTYYGRKRSLKLIVSGGG